MPLLQEWNSDPYSLAAIWKIEEPEAFFSERTGIHSEIKSQKRRLEYLAGRFLLKYLKTDFPLVSILPDEHDKPRIENNRYFFSISHSFPFVAAVVSPYVECGIDIQTWHPRILQLQHKFLSPKEQLFFKNEPELVTLAWSAKEAAYKWQGRRGVDFMKHMPIKEFYEHAGRFNITILMDLSFPRQHIQTEGIVTECFSCAFVCQNITHYLDS